jgi:antitoxin (DNA-binding transcriptional repressor) of toxin-antitoxin stability system
VGQVVFGKKHILITKRGKPMARLVPADEIDLHLLNAKGWLEDDDPFFNIIDRIIQERARHAPRILKETSSVYCKSIHCGHSQSPPLFKNKGFNS